MTKSKTQRERAKAQRAAAATAATQAIVKRASKKEKFSWGGMLKGAAKLAAELAPAVLPALLANHGPTVAAVQTHRLTGGYAPTSGAALAAPMSLGSQVGVFDVKPVKRDGRVIGMRLVGMDYVGDIVSASGNNKGDLLLELDLNPRSNGWSGTRAQRESALYERFTVHKLAGMCEPSCPATTEGQIIAFIDTDPDEEFDVSGTAAVQRAAAHSGSEVGQVWQMTCCEYRPDRDTQAFYADANGSDIRLVSPGTLRIVAATDLAAGTFGALYVAYDIEFSVPQIETSGAVGNYAHLNSTGSLTVSTPMGDGDWDAQVAAGLAVGDGGANFSANYSTLNGAGVTVSSYSGLPVGTYDVVVQMTGTTLGTQSTTNYATGPVGASAYVLTYVGARMLTVASGSYVLLQLVVNVDTSKDPGQGWFSFNVQSGAIADTKVTFLQKPSGLSVARKMTLRDYERLTKSLADRLAALELAIAPQQSSHSHSSTSLSRYGGHARSAQQTF